MINIDIVGLYIVRT